MVMSSAPFYSNPLSIENEYQNLCDKLELFENQMKVSESRIFSYGVQLANSFKTKQDLIELHNLSEDENIKHIINENGIEFISRNGVVLFAYILCDHDFYTPIDPIIVVSKFTECLKC